MLYAVLCAFTVFIPTSNGYPTLLFTTTKDIRIANISRPSKVSIIVKDLESGGAVDFYHEGRTICWSDSRLGTIQCVTHNNNHIGPKATLVSGLVMPDGLACDWLTQKLYWTEGETNRIEVVSLDGRHRKVLFWEDLDQPRAIALVPMESIMFWTDWGEVPKIERAAMNGDPLSRKVVVSEKIFWPNGITADYEARRLYWLDGKLHFIEVMDYDGRNRRRVLEGEQILQYPFSLALFKEKLFWTDWETWSLHVLERNTSLTKKLIDNLGSVPVDVRVMDPSRQPYKQTPCSLDNGGCSHLCLLSPIRPGYSCACPTGIRLIDDHTCADGPKEMILLVQINEISVISLDSPDHTSVPLDLRGIKHAIGVDFDPQNDWIYWTDFEAKIIRRAKLNGTSQEDVISNELQRPDGIAVDWRAQNLYWTDSGSDRIQVLRIDTPYTKVLVNTELEEPRAIVVSPDEGLMFWSDWFEKRPKIERSALDGSDRVLLVGDHLGWPNGLALDIPQTKVYWCDAKTDKIEVINYDGSDRREVITENLPHVFGVALSGDYLYWTDWQRRSLDSGHKVTGANRKVILDHLANIMGLKAIRRPLDKPKTSNPCSINNGNCVHLCLNTPVKFNCACQMGYELKSDGRSCVIPEAFLLFTRKENIGRISIENPHNDAIIPATGIKDASALDFDIRDKRIYWADVKAKAIARAFVNGSNVEKIIEFGLESPEGLAVDWVSHNIYWTDTGLKRIEVARVDGKFRRAVIWNNLQEPRSIAVDPNQGFIYWSDWAGQGSLHRATVSGIGHKTLISKLGRANSLTIDPVEGRIFWCGIQGQIESAELDGTKRKVVVLSPCPFTMSLYQDKIYWSDWKTGELFVANKHTGNKTLLHSNLEQVTSVVVYHGWGRQGWSSCSGSNLKCPHLCLAGTCVCQAHYTYYDGKCHPPSTFMVVSTRNSVIRLLVDSDECPDSPVPAHGLKNVKGIDYDPLHNVLFWLDGRSQNIRKWNGASGGATVVVSGDYHPFSFALDPVYRVLFWSCSLDGTINATKLDNGSTSTVVVIRTHPSEQPKYLAVHPFKGLLFWTTEGRDTRIYRSRMDGTRRTVLITSSSPITSLTVDPDHNMMYWATPSALESSDLNGKNRAVVTAGEKFNSITALGKSVYWLSGQSVMTKSRQGRVEHFWTSPHPLTSLIAVRPPFKKGSQPPLWECITGERVPSHTDCSREGPCSPDHFSCVSSPGDCVPMKWRCDSADDCLDGSDEANCPQCGPDKFTCQPSHCIDLSFVCDGTPHCPDNSDERSCCSATGGHQCSGIGPNYLVGGLSGATCLPAHLVCDGVAHCSDRSDESAEACANSERQRTLAAASSSDSQGYILLIAFVVVSLIFLAGYSGYRWRSRTAKSDVVGAVGDPALDPLSPKTRRCCSAAGGSNGKGCRPNNVGHACVIMSSLQRSTSSQPSSGSLLCYPLNPPPSPATTSKETTRVGFYRPPPPTPCSTDVCHESDSNYQGESEPLPPPPTPTSASPSPSSSTYFHPTPPPPSPTTG